jgi:hypothetical protein
MKITFVALLGVGALATPANGMGTILGLAEKSSPVHENARRLNGIVTLASYNFDGGDPQGWTTGDDAETACGNTVGATDHWSLGDTLPGKDLTTGPGGSDNWWTNPNDGTQGADRSYVTSPTITTTCACPSISFDSYTSNEQGYPPDLDNGWDVEHVQLSINGGDFTDIHGEVTELHENCDREFRIITFTTSSGIAVADTLKYRFLMDTCDAMFDCGDGTIQGWAFDNVRITCPDDCTPPPCRAGCEGDPHFKTWRGQRFDFHGECDLVLLHSPAFESGLGLDVHIRTKLRRDMSYISSAALRIGSDVLEVESQGIYYLNGVAGAALPAEFSGFEFWHTQPSDKQHVFEVHLGGRERIKLKTYKDFVSVLIEQGENKHFGDSAGLMGDFRMGDMIARDGKTIIEDANAFGQEWQVLNTEPSLFHTVRLPQHPNVCTMPPPMQASQVRRRLLESSSIDELAAETACAHWGEGKDACVFDVLTTGDLEMALVGAY